MNGQMDGRNFSPFYRTLSPLGAAAQKAAVPLPCFFAVLKSQRVAGQQPREGTKSCRMGRNSVRPSVHPLVHPWACQRALRARWRVLRANLRSLRGLRVSWRSLRASQGGTYGQTDRRTYGISPHSTGLRPLSGPLPKKQGKGTADLMMPFGDWFLPPSFLGPLPCPPGPPWDPGPLTTCLT